MLEWYAVLLADQVLPTNKLWCVPNHVNHRFRMLAQVCTAKGHTPLADSMPRSSIILYNVEMTDGQRLNQVSKASIVKALKDSHPEAYKMLPDTWQPKAKKKRKSRAR